VAFNHWLARLVAFGQWRGCVIFDTTLRDFRGGNTIILSHKHHGAMDGQTNEKLIEKVGLSTRFATINGPSRWNLATPAPSMWTQHTFSLSQLEYRNTY
jgi:hypothetical protein